jgi:hypothetical protein
MADLYDIERRLQEAVAAIPPDLRPSILHALTLPDEERAAGIGRLWKDERTRGIAEMLIDLEEDRALKAAVLGELRPLRE